MENLTNLYKYVYDFIYDLRYVIIELIEIMQEIHGRLMWCILEISRIKQWHIKYIFLNKTDLKKICSQKLLIGFSLCLRSISPEYPGLHLGTTT